MCGGYNGRMSPAVFRQIMSEYEASQTQQDEADQLVSDIQETRGRLSSVRTYDFSTSDEDNGLTDRRVAMSH